MGIIFKQILGGGSEEVGRGEDYLINTKKVRLKSSKEIIISNIKFIQNSLEERKG